MMSRSYVTVTARGNPPRVIEQIQQAIQNLSLTNLILVIKTERQPRGRGEHYIFLGLNLQAETLHLPSHVLAQLQPLVQLMKLGRSLITQLLSEEQIQGMVGPSEIETYRLNSLKYYPQLYDRPDNFAFLPAELEEEQNGQDSPLFERLLFWLSAQAEGTRSGFVNTCINLGLAEGNGSWKSRSILRRLRLLGHLEYSYRNSWWSICPAALVRPVIAEKGLFLTGQRTAELLNANSAHFQYAQQPAGQGPPRITADTLSLLPHNAGCFSLHLAQLLPELQEWKRTLAPLDGVRLEKYHIQRWNGSRFIDADDLFYDDQQQENLSGWYLLKTEGGPFQLSLFYDAQQRQWLQGDWYGLRFLANQTASRMNLEVIYDPDSAELLIPSAQRWPLLYERALVLASGFLPEISADRQWLKYHGISKPLCGQLTDKLNLSVARMSYA
jgi:hypothetical protein